jgi:hypothetical protein
MADWAKTAPSEELQTMSSAMQPLPGEETPSLTMEDVEGIVEQPVQALLVPTIESATPLLAHMPFGVIDTDDSPGFIASDAPCVWFDPALLKKPQRLGAGGLISPSIQVSMPLSPRQLVIFGHWLKANGGHLRLEPDNPLVDQLNQRVCRFADEYVVVNQNVFKPAWL